MQHVVGIKVTVTLDVSMNITVKRALMSVVSSVRLAISQQGLVMKRQVIVNLAVLTDIMVKNVSNSVVQVVYLISPLTYRLTHLCYPFVILIMVFAALVVTIAIIFQIVLVSAAHIV